MEQETIFGLVRALFWLGGTIYICGGIWFPVWFGRRFSFEAWFGQPPMPGYMYREPRLTRFLLGPWVAAGVGVFVYYAVYPIIDVIPFEWGSLDEDGEWSSTQSLVRYTLTLVGTLALFDTLEKRGIDALKEEMRQRDERRRSWDSSSG